MENPLVVNPHSDRVRAVAALASRSVRQRRGLFLVEGPQAVHEALRYWPLKCVYVAEGASSRRDMVGLARDRDIEAVVVSEDVLRAMSSSAQGVVAVAHMQASTLADVVGSEYTQSPSLRNQCLVLNQVRDPGNVGTMVRTADAVGACSVVAISGTVDLTNPKVVRSTVGSLFHVPWVSSVSLSEAVHTLKGAGYFVAASDSKGELPVEQVAEVANTRPIAWIVGNEAWGYERDERSMADAVVRIPMGGRTESLNVAVAAALCLYTVSHYLSGER